MIWNHGSCHRVIQRLMLCVAVMFALGLDPPSSYPQSSITQQIQVELFLTSESDQCQRAQTYIQELQRRRAGLSVSVHDVRKDPAALRRLGKLAKRFGHAKAGVPSFYLADALIMGFRDDQTTGRRIEDLLRIDAYIRPGCRHCQDAKRFLDELLQRRPALALIYHDVVNDREARAEVARLASQYQVQVASFPCIRVAGRLVVGFQSAETTGRKIEDFFRTSSAEISQPRSPHNGTRRETSSGQERLSHSGTRLAAGFWGGSQQQPSAPDAQPTEPIPATDTANPSDLPSDLPNDSPEEVQVLTDDDVLILESSEQDVIDGMPTGSQELEGETDDVIEVPLFGRLRVSQLGLPVFTFLIGLVDGFNPCAMWVLVFLLSVLVNIKERKKIIVIAGTFVVVSGLAYFAFMAAWFNVFQLIGLLRPVQVGLGLVALVVGAINVKDFFAFHKGVSLSIPDSAKPGIYRRVRQIVSAKHLTVALLGAISLAIVVNIIELLCTAGLPALYTQILTMQHLPIWANYMYLALYIAAYMFDDTLLVTAVVVTLSHRKLQEAEGRWLKLLSGCVILVLGAMMIFKPEWLV